MNLLLAMRIPLERNESVFHSLTALTNLNGHNRWYILFSMYCNSSPLRSLCYHRKLMWKCSTIGLLIIVKALGHIMTAAKMLVLSVVSPHERVDMKFVLEDARKQWALQSKRITIISEIDKDRHQTNDLSIPQWEDQILLLCGFFFFFCRLWTL